MAIIAASVLVGLTVQGTALAQNGAKIEARVVAAVKKVENACRADLTKYCDGVTPGEGRQLLCLEAHEDKLSSTCDYALFDASRNLNRALDRIAESADACWPDIEKHCATTPMGGGQIGQCLAANKASLGKACRAVLTKFEQAN